MKKRTILQLFKNKQLRVPSVGVTAYDYPTARIVNNSNVDFIVVGDTVGPTTHGVQNLNRVSMSMMLTHCEAVKRGNQNQFLIGDMPFLSYQLSNTDAIRNAGEFVRSGMDAVKLEGHFPERIKAIADSGTLIMAHLGLTPQTQARLGGYRVQAKTGQEIDQLLQQAKSVEQSGASLLLLEAVPAEVAEMVRNELNIPVYGIGAGPKVDGQLAIIHDLLGLFWDFKPKFIKQYVNGEEVFLKAIQEYAKEVVETKFPTDSQSYHLQEEALDALLARSGSSWKYEKAG